MSEREFKARPPFSVGDRVIPKIEWESYYLNRSGPCSRETPSVVESTHWDAGQASWFIKIKGSARYARRWELADNRKMTLDEVFR